VEKRDAEIKDTSGRCQAVQETGTGKIVRGSAFKRHILTGKTTKSKRQMRGMKQVADQDAPKLNRMLPYK
jgi:large subunit ribosomal protein L35